MKTHPTRTAARFAYTLVAVGALLLGSNFVRTHLEAQAWSAMSELEHEKAPSMRFVMEIQHPIDSFAPEGASAALPQPANRTCRRSAAGQQGSLPDGHPSFDETDSAAPSLPSSGDLMPAPLPAPHPRTPIFDI